MNGLEIAELAGSTIARLAPFIAQGIQLGLRGDPTLERQLRGAIELASQALLDADKQFEKLMKDAEEKLGK